jgi:plasmid stabilization system protein ParE
MRVVITAAAKADLIAIRRFIEPLLDRCQALAETPRDYSLAPRYERFGIRRCVNGDYLIFYRLTAEVVEVIHILQGARDVEALLFRSP